MLNQVAIFYQHRRVLKVKLGPQRVTVEVQLHDMGISGAPYYCTIRAIFRPLYTPRKTCGKRQTPDRSPKHDQSPNERTMTREASVGSWRDSSERHGKEALCARRARGGRELAQPQESSGRCRGQGGVVTQVLTSQATASPLAPPPTPSCGVQ